VFGVGAHCAGGSSPDFVQISDLITKIVDPRYFIYD